jgi:catechol 2,3-dioxygenase-like lactoylglutathione lyase family enzyme
MKMKFGTPTAPREAAMIKSLDHVNIVTKNFPETIRFYTEVLGMKNAGLPGGMVSKRNAFICDDNDNAVLHVQGVDPEDPQATFDSIRQRLGNLRTAIGLEDLDGSASIEHVAFACHDYNAVRDRLGRHGLEMRFNDVPQMGLRQIFVNDPNGITLELNFRTT